MGTFLVLDIPKVPSDSTIWELRKSIFRIFGIKNLSRLDSRDMCTNKTFPISAKPIYGPIPILSADTDTDYDIGCSLEGLIFLLF